jgi:hypothetical protein
VHGGGQTMSDQPRLFIHMPGVGFVGVKVPGTYWDLQFWRAIYKAQGTCTALIHMDCVPDLRITRYRITVRAT